MFHVDTLLDSVLNNFTIHFQSLISLIYDEHFKKKIINKLTNKI